LSNHHILMNMKRLILFIFVLLTTAASADKRDIPDDDTDLTAVEIEYPGYFPQLMVPADYEVTEEGVALGRKIYYDKMLSQGGPLEGNACATCHIQSIRECR